MLHEAVFLATFNTTMTTEKHCKLQRGCHTVATFFCNLQRARWKCQPSWNLKEQNCVASFESRVTCLATLRKVEDSSTSLATRNATLLLHCSCKNGVLHKAIFRSTCAATKLRDKLQKKIASCNMAFNINFGETRTFSLYSVVILVALRIELNVLSRRQSTLVIANSVGTCSLESVKSMRK